MVYCSNCGTDNTEGNRFCNSCGNTLMDRGYNTGQGSYNSWDQEKPEGRNYAILGIVFAFCSLIILPIIFGPLAVIFGILAVLKDDSSWGIAAIVLGVVLATISALLGMMFMYGTI